MAHPWPVSKVPSVDALVRSTLLNPNEQLRRDETEKLLIINEATGEQVEFPLAPG